MVAASEISGGKYYFERLNVGNQCQPYMLGTLYLVGHVSIAEH